MSDEPIKRVFCKDCRHLHRFLAFGLDGAPELHDATCDKDPEIVGTCPVAGDRFERARVMVRNANFDCPLFEPLPLPLLEPVPKRPWWRFWSSQ